MRTLQYMVRFILRLIGRKKPAATRFCVEKHANLLEDTGKKDLMQTLVMAVVQLQITELGMR